jgi:hypothetical protein
MENPKTIKPGKYKTVDGENASVWDWGQNMLQEWCYRGTIQGQGFCTWDKDGKDLDGNSHLVLQ